MSRHLGGLALLEIESGVSDRTGEGFCVVRAIGDDGSRLVGQMSVQEMRAQALVFLGCAAAAETDSMLLAVLSDVGVDVRAAGTLISRLRARRDG